MQAKKKKETRRIISEPLNQDITFAQVMLSSFTLMLLSYQSSY